MARFFKARLAKSGIQLKLSCQFVCEYGAAEPPKCLNYNVENETNSPSFSPFKLVLVAGPDIEIG